MENQTQNPFLSSAVIIGFIFSAIISVVSLSISYSIINSDPSTSQLILFTSMAVLSCIIGLLAGLFAVRHHVKMFDAPLKLGRGAVIGAVTGVLISIFATLLGLVWLIVDPAYYDKLLEAMIANFELIGMPEAQYNQTIDGLHEQFQSQKTVTGMLRTTAINAAIYAALNALTGMIGVKFFAPKSDDPDSL